MKTRILEPTAENIREAGRALSEGKLVAFPTETVYGLGADAFNEDAVKAVYAAKGRPSDNPMIVHISDVKQLEMLASSPNNDVYKLAGRLWPGPLTMIVKKVEGIPDATTGGLDTVGVRMPSDEIARALIDAAGCPVAAPSANISGRPSPTMAQHVIDDMSGRIDYIIKGADCRVGIESTVVDMTGDTPVILRPGIVTREQISEILSKDVEIDPAVLRKSLTDESFVPKAPGMKYRHYAPEADMIVFSGRRDSVEEQIRRVKKENEDRGLKVGVILFDDNDSEEAARKFFAELRRMDAEKVQLILAGALSGNDEVGFAVMNRMLKSAGYNIKKVEKEVDKMIIALASDHGGFRLKEQIKEHLEARGLDTKDLGTHSEDSVDYPIFGQKCGEAVASGEADLGIVVCGTGIGISIAANKVKGVRCGLCTSVEMAKLTKQHNNANILALGGRTTAPELAMEIVDAWLDTEFEGGRHQRRVDMLDNM